MAPGYGRVAGYVVIATRRAGGRAAPVLSTTDLSEVPAVDRLHLETNRQSRHERILAPRLAAACGCPARRSHRCSEDTPARRPVARSPRTPPQFFCGRSWVS